MPCSCLRSDTTFFQKAQAKNPALLMLTRPSIDCTRVHPANNSPFIPFRFQGTGSDVLFRSPLFHDQTQLTISSPCSDHPEVPSTSRLQEVNISKRTDASLDDKLAVFVAVLWMVSRPVGCWECAGGPKGGWPGTRRVLCNGALLVCDRDNDCMGQDSVLVRRLGLCVCIFFCLWIWLFDLREGRIAR